MPRSGWVYDREYRKRGVRTTAAAVTNDFSRGSVPKNILALAGPMTAAQLVNVLYSVVDRIYLGLLPGHLALTGVGVTLPVISIIMGLANLCGTGGAPLCSMYRGRADRDEAERIMGNCLTLLLFFGGAVTALFLLIKEPMLYLFGASPDTFPYANAYMTIYLLGTVFVMIGLGMNPFINTQGFGKVGMLTVCLGAAANIVLDPIFIFVLDLGVEGAALATVISQAASAAWVLRFLPGPKAILRLRLSCPAPSSASSTGRSRCWPPASPPFASISACLSPCPCRWPGRAFLSAWAAPGRPSSSPCCARL